MGSLLLFKPHYQIFTTSEDVCRKKWYIQMYKSPFKHPNQLPFITIYCLKQLRADTFQTSTIFDISPEVRAAKVQPQATHSSAPKTEAVKTEPVRLEERPEGQAFHLA